MIISGPAPGPLPGAARAAATIGLIVMLAIVLLASLTSLNELARTLPQYRNYLYEPMQTIAPSLQRMGFTVSVVELKYIDPNAVRPSPACSPAVECHVLYFLLLLTVVFMLLEVPQLPAKQQLMSRPVEGMGHPAGHRQRIALSGAENCDKPDHRPGGLGMLGCWMCACRGYWPSRTIFPHRFRAGGHSADPAGAGVRWSVRGAGSAGRLPDRQPGIRQYSRTSYHGARAGPRRWWYSCP